MSGEVEQQTQDQFIPNPQVAVRCRAKRLFEIIPKLNDAQRSAVRRIGFGGLLELKFKHFPFEHIDLFMKCFADGSYVFKAPKSKHFMVSKHDVHDCFSLPLGPNELDLLPTGSQKGSDSPECVDLKSRWRNTFGVKNSKDSIPIGKLKVAIENDTEGGDHFCRMFVLLCMSSFLAPTIKDNVDFKLLKAVEDVDAISQSDWCSYILKAIVGAGKDAKVKKSTLVGCIPFLMITYFQRFDFRGEIPHHDLPLIKHWDEARLKDRIKGEVADGGLGRQTWSIVKYPRCIHAPANNQVNVIGEPRLQIVPEAIHASTNNRINVGGDAQLRVLPAPPEVKAPPSTSKPPKKFIEIELPEGVDDDQRLKVLAVDVSPN